MRRIMRRGGRGRTALLAVVAAMASAPADPGLAAVPERPAQGTCAMPVAGSQTLCLINRERAALGRPPLRWQPELAVMALRHSQDMIGRRFFSHIAPGGEDLRDRVVQTSYVSAARMWRVGEVLAWATGPRDAPADIVTAWLNSPPHRRLLLDGRYRDVGLGVVADVPVAGVQSGGSTYTAELGVREAGAAVPSERNAREARAAGGVRLG